MGRVVGFIVFIVAVALVGCCYDSFEGDGELPSGDALTPNITIEALSGMLLTERMAIYDDIVVRGTVTSTDENGNFYKTFIIEQDGYGLEVLEGLYDSYVRHDVGSQVTVNLQGLSIARYNGVLQVGLEAQEGSYYTLDYLSAEPLIDEHIFCSYTYDDVEPYVIGYDSLAESMCGRLVCLDSLLHQPSEDQLQPYMWEGYQQFVNNSGDSLWCYTSDYANFALLAIPQERVSLCGILRWASISGVSGGERFFVEMRGVEDCIAY